MTTDPHVRRFGVAQCRLDHKRSTLVELGRQLPDDSKEAPKRGMPDFAQTVTQEQLVSMLPQRVRHGRVDALGFRGSVVGECDDSRSETSSDRRGGSTDRYAIVWVATGSH